MSCAQREQGNSRATMKVARSIYLKGKSNIRSDASGSVTLIHMLQNVTYSMRSMAQPEPSATRKTLYFRFVRLLRSLTMRAGVLPLPCQFQSLR